MNFVEQLKGLCKWYDTIDNTLVKRLISEHEEATKVLQEFVDAIDVKADPTKEWIDFDEVYYKACAILDIEVSNESYTCRDCGRGMVVNGVCGNCGQW